MGVPIGELFRRHLLPTLAGTFAVVACFAIFYLATSFALAHGTTALGYPKEQFLLIQLGAILFMAGGIIFAGYWSDATSAQRVLTWGCGATILIGFLFGPSLASGSWLVIFAGLAAALGCRIEDLTPLRLCRIPRANPVDFRADIDAIAGRFGITPAKLADVVRQGQGMARLRAAAPATTEAGFLLAARDDEPKPPAIEEPPS